MEQRAAQANWTSQAILAPSSPGGATIGDAAEAPSAALRAAVMLAAGCASSRGLRAAGPARSA